MNSLDSNPCFSLVKILEQVIKVNSYRVCCRCIILIIIILLIILIDQSVFQKIQEHACFMDASNLFLSQIPLYTWQILFGYSFITYKLINFNGCIEGAGLAKLEQKLLVGIEREFMADFCLVSYGTNILS